MERFFVCSGIWVRADYKAGGLVYGGERYWVAHAQALHRCGLGEGRPLDSPEPFFPLSRFSVLPDQLQEALLQIWQRIAQADLYPRVSHSHDCSSILLSIRDT